MTFKVPFLSDAQLESAAQELLTESMRQCARAPLPDRLAWYTDGHRIGCPSPWPRSRARIVPALRFATQQQGGET